jgi:hypothetical protein
MERPNSGISPEVHHPGTQADSLPEQAPVRPNVPIEPVHEYPERHIHPVTVVHPELVVMPESGQTEQPKELTHVEEKALTPVKETEPEKINEEIDVSPQKNNFSGTRPLIFSGPSLPKKMKFKGKVGRQRTNEEVIDLLTYVQTKGAWPGGVSDQMQRYYRREYPEYFRKRKKGNTGKVPAVRPAPVDIQARRRGTV